MLLVAIPVSLTVAGLVPIPANHLRAMAPWSTAAVRPPPPEWQWDSLWWDGVAQFWPWRRILRMALGSGQVPLWSPWSLCGQPFAANAQSACFYPPVVLACWLLPAHRALGWLWAFHVALAAAFTYGLGRRLRMSGAGAAAAGIVYAGGGFMLAWTPVPSLMHSATWLPGALWAIESVLHENRRWGALGLGAALAMAVLAGHLQVAGYVWLTCAVWAAGRVTLRAARGKSARGWPVVAGFALAVALSAVQWMPAAELGRLSPRGGVRPTVEGWMFARELALKPVHLLTVLWPTALGSPRTGTYRGIAFAEHFAGIGPLSMALVVLALVSRRNKWVWGALAVVGCALLVAMGTPLSRALYFHLPFLGLTAGFQRVLFVFCLALALLAGMGVDAVVKGRGRGRASGMVAAGLLVALVAQSAWMTLSILPLSRAGLVAAEGRDAAVVRWLASHADEGARFLALTPREMWRLKPRPYAALPPNTAVLLGLQDVQGYDSLYPAAFKRAAAAAEGRDPSPLTNGNMVLLENVGARELGELGVRYVISAWPIAEPGLRLVRRFEPSPMAPAWHGPVFVYERADFLPRWRVRRGDGMVAADALRCEYNHVALRVPAGGGTLELADTVYPGWRAYVNGRRVAWRVRRDLPAVRCVGLGSGQGEAVVDFVYWPGTVVAGLFLSLLGLFAISAAVGLGRGRVEK